MTSSLFDLAGRVVVVTGSGRGLGKVMAQGLAAAGATLVTCSRTLVEAEGTAAEIRARGGRATAFRADTASRTSVEELIAATVDFYGRIDVMVNNAGIDIIEPAEDVTEEHWRAVLDINLTGYFYGAQVAGRQMISQQGGGSIVNISSIAGGVGIRGLASYSAAKGGVDQLTKVMAIEWAQHRIRVNAIAPGYYDNIMQDAGGEHSRPEKQEQIRTFTPMRRRGLPEELVGPVVFLASDAASYVTGAVLYVDGGYTAA